MPITKLSLNGDYLQSAGDCKKGHRRWSALGLGGEKHTSAGLCLNQYSDRVPRRGLGESAAVL
jgi:hypothetical protein